MALDRRRLRYGGNAAVAILAGAALCAVLNAIAASRFQRWDWTGSKIYSLSEKTVNVLEALGTEVDVTVLLQPEQELYDEVHEILSRYRAVSPRLRLEFLDPAREPARVGQLLQRFGLDPRGDTTAVVFSAGDRHKHVAVAELVDYDMSEAAFGAPPKIRAFKGEAAFTSALLSVTESRLRTACFLSGHGEAVPEGEADISRFAESLRRANLRIETTDALGKSPLPQSCDLLVVAGPSRAFTPPEAEALGAWIDAGGRLLALIDPPFSREGTLLDLGIETTLLDRGFSLGRDIALDPSQRLLFATSESFAASDYLPHPVTEGLAGTFIVLGLARSVAAVQPPPEGWTLSPLVRTSDKGWAERDLANLSSVTKGPGDLPGPISLALAGEKHADKDKTARIVAIGDSDLARDALLGSGANLDILLNAVNWLTGAEEQIGIAPREPEQVHLVMTRGQERTVIYATLLGLPGATILAGVVVWLFRRR